MWQVIGNVVIKQTTIYICISLVGTVLRNTWQQTRFWWQWIITLYFDILEKYLQFGKNKRTSISLPHTNNRIYLLRYFFQTKYLKYMYITLKGIGKIMFASVVRMLLICKFLHFTALITKNIWTFQSLRTLFRVRKLISV